MWYTNYKTSKIYFQGKKVKNMEAESIESIELETVLLWNEHGIKYWYKFVVAGLDVC